MDVKGLVRNLAQSINDQRTDRYVRHEMTIHDINVNVIGASPVYGLDVVTQTGEVGGKNRWGDLDHVETPVKSEPVDDHKIMKGAKKR
jgi:hypothetical protein